jgi:plastocyanin
MRNRASFTLAAALVAVALLALTGLAGAGGSPKVRVGDNFFNPERLQVGKGTKVRFRWVNTEEKHNIIKVKGPGRDFSSDTTDQPGFVFSKRFRKAGRYKIICSIHPDDMVVRVKVG